MDIERLTNDLEAVLERCRSALDHEVEKARKAVTALNVEKGRAQNALTEILAQHATAKNNLAVALKHLGQATTLYSLNTATTALAALAKRITASEAQNLALDNETRRLVAIRSEGEAAMADIKLKLRQIQIGQVQP